MALSAVLAGCGPRPIGYSLVFWAEEGAPYRTGELLRVVKESQVQETYLVQLPHSKELTELPRFRAAFYQSEQEARDAKKAYAPFAAVFGYSKKDGLPIREKPTQEAKQIYKLREGQIVKILSRNEEKVSIANYRDYWYRVLTSDGFSGFSFGAFLPVFSSLGDPEAEVEMLRSQDPVLDTILSTVWRPEYFQEMRDKGRIDLVRFSGDFGLFPQRSANTVDLVMSTYRQHFEYNEIVRLGPGRYHFKGSDLRLHLTTAGRLMATFNRNGLLLSQVFLRFTADLDRLRNDELERRDRLFQVFLARGRILSSSAYGSIRLSQGRRFNWVDFERLHVFLKPVQGDGRVYFRYFLSGELAARYDGVVSFRFSEYSEVEETSFVYVFDDLGVRFLFLSPDYIDQLEVKSLGISPLVIHFNFGSL